jgi:hypothetical protein
MFHHSFDMPTLRRLENSLRSPAVYLANAWTGEYVRRFLNRLAHLPTPTGFSVMDTGAVRLEWDTPKRTFTAIILGDGLHMTCLACADETQPFCPSDDPMLDVQQGIVWAMTNGI